MRCAKCGTEWTTGLSKRMIDCPFCGEPLMGIIPHQQAVDAFRMIIDKFGIGIYAEERRLIGLINDILPNTAKEKNILKTVISLGIPKIVAPLSPGTANQEVILKRGYELLERGGLSSEWCASRFLY